jgi:predicted GNAT family N-acyltransferase
VSGTVQFTVRRLAGPAEMDAALALRYEVFCREQGVPAHEEQDGRDRDGLHLVAVANGELLGTCRLLFVGPTVQFSRLAVARPARPPGVAAPRRELAEAEARAGRARRLVLHAQTYAQSLYEQAGYRPRGRVFVEANIEHVAMERVLD